MARRHSGPIDATPDLCAELVVHGESRTTRIGEFRLSRFREGDPIVSEAYVISAESAAVLGPENMVH